MATEELVAEGQRLALAQRDATRRMVSQSSQTVQIGTATQERLVQQAEQLRRMQDDLDVIGENQDRIQGQLQVVNSLAGQVCQTIVPVTVTARNSTVKLDKQLAKAEKKREKEREKQRQKEDKAARQLAKKRGKGATVAPRLPPEVTVLGGEAVEALQETDDNLDIISDNVTRLKVIAGQMKDQLIDQDKQLTQINQTSHARNLKTRELEHQTKRMLG